MPACFICEVTWWHSMRACILNVVGRIYYVRVVINYNPYITCSPKLNFNTFFKFRSPYKSLHVTQVCNTSTYLTRCWIHGIPYTAVHLIFIALWYYLGVVTKVLLPNLNVCYEYGLYVLKLKYYLNTAAISSWRQNV